jgi:hypothetical protein
MKSAILGKGPSCFEMGYNPRQPNCKNCIYWKFSLNIEDIPHGTCRIPDRSGEQTTASWHKCKHYDDGEASLLHFNEECSK